MLKNIKMGDFDGLLRRDTRRFGALAPTLLFLASLSNKQNDLDFAGR